MVRENVSKWPQLALLRLNLYLVLDNIKGLLDIERQKRCLEKFAIIQSMLQVASGSTMDEELRNADYVDEDQLLSLSVMVGNDSLIDEVQVFREHANGFAEHMFLQVHFAPMNREQLKVIMWDTMVEAYGDTCNFLLHVYENYFN